MGVATLLFAVLIALRGPFSEACKLGKPGQGTCLTKNCGKILGVLQSASNGSYLTLSSSGGNNYEFYTDLINNGVTQTWNTYPFVAQGTANSYSACCQLCAATPGCVLWHHFPLFANDIFPGIDLPVGTNVAYPKPYPPCNLKYGCTSPGGVTYNPNGGNCVMFNYNGTQTCTNAGVSVLCPPTGIGPTTTTQISNYNRSYFGGPCNPVASVVNDPHFVGGDGVRFDFNGNLGKSFCLISDSNLHVNMLLEGYMDSRTYGASLVKNGKAMRSWITALNFMWKDDVGSGHTLFMRARRGNEQRRGNGFLTELILDGQRLTIPDQPGQSIESTGMKFLLVKQGVRGPYDEDHFLLSISDILSAGTSLRVAHPLLQTPEDAYAHFNVRLTSFRPSPQVHGVLGQTFRQDAGRTLRVLEYKLLSSLLNGPIQADGETGVGYLEGSPSDYLTSAILKPDCKYSKW